MLEWFSNLEFLSKLYWSTALVGSLVFIIVMIMAFLGGDADDIGDMDADIDTDANPLRSPLMSINKTGTP